MKNNEDIYRTRKRKAIENLIKNKMFIKTFFKLFIRESDTIYFYYCSMQQAIKCLKKFKLCIKSSNNFQTENKDN